MPNVTVTGQVPTEELQKRLNWIKEKCPEFVDSIRSEHIVNQSPDGSTYEQDALVFTLGSTVVSWDAKQVEGFPHVALTEANSILGFASRPASYYSEPVPNAPVPALNLFGTAAPELAYLFSGSVPFRAAGPVTEGQVAVGPFGKTYVAKRCSIGFFPTIMWVVS